MVWMGCLLIASLALGRPALAQAPGGADQLGGQLAANGTTVSFRVFSQNATRLEVALYRQSYGAPPVARYAMSRLPGTSVWQVLVQMPHVRPSVNLLAAFLQLLSPGGLNGQHHPPDGADH